MIRETFYPGLAYHHSKIMLFKTHKAKNSHYVTLVAKYDL